MGLVSALGLSPPCPRGLFRPISCHLQCRSYHPPQTNSRSPATSRRFRACPRRTSRWPGASCGRTLIIHGPRTRHLGSPGPGAQRFQLGHARGYHSRPANQRRFRTVKAYFDTTVLVAASVAGHPHHAQALSTLLAVHNKTVTGCVSGHGLSELYAVSRLRFTPWKRGKSFPRTFFPIFKLSPSRREYIAIR